MREEKEIKKVDVEEKLGWNSFNVDKEEHIKLDQKKCREQCETKICVLVCPANLYQLKDGEVIFNYEGCLECGACRVSCPKEALSWSYPRGGFGIRYRYG